METLAIPDLLTYLQSHPLPANFNRAADILQSRHDSLLDDLTIKEVDLVELDSRCKALERNLADSETETARLKGLCHDACKRAQTSQDKLEFFIQAHKDLYPDRIILVSDSEDDADAAIVDAGVITLEDGDDGKGYLPTLMPRRKRRFVFDSDSEDETEGANGRVLRSRVSVRRRIVFSDDEGDEENEDGMESEGESLDGFIVGDSSEPESNCSQDAASEEKGQSDSDVELDTVLAKIHRVKDLNKWDYEADMLAAFAKDDELCMKAVCDLWRLQTDEEKNIKHVIVLNNRGFNKFDANRGSLMAEFLTDGERDGPLKKTVQELEEFDPQGVDYCRKLAFHYSGQLFSLYKIGAEVGGI